MMQPSDRWILVGAAALAIGSIVVAVMTVNNGPESAAWLDRLEDRLAQVDQAPPNLPSAPDHLGSFYYNNRVEAGTRPAPEWAGFLRPKLVEEATEPLELPPLQILPAGYPVMIDRTIEKVTLEWTVAAPEYDNPESRPVDLQPATKIRIWRSEADGPFRVLAEVGPEVRDFEDTAIRPLTAYAYRIEPVCEGERSITDGPTLWVRTPSRQRARLIGGDRRVALLRVERYDKGMWTGRTVTVRPGGVFGKPEWRLDALRFDKSTLEAVVTDDEGKTRTLKTRR